MSLPRVWILILTHNRSRVFRAALEMPAFGRAIQAYPGEVRMMIQAQACTDDTWTWLKQYPACAPVPEERVTVEHIDFNLWAIGGRHRQIDWLIEQGLQADDVVIFYDDDIRAAGSDWLLMYVSALLNDDRAGAVGIEGKTFKTGWAGSYGVQYGQAPVEVDVVGGGWLAVRGEVLLQGANYDLAQMPFWGGDDDFCLQVREKGWKVVCIGKQGETGLSHQPAHRADDGYHKSMRRLKAKWAGRGVALFADGGVPNGTPGEAAAHG